MITCSRCPREVEHIRALLSHWETEHGGIPEMRVREMEEIRELEPVPALDGLRRSQMVRWYHGTGRLLGGKWAS